MEHSQWFIKSLTGWLDIWSSYPLCNALSFWQSTLLFPFSCYKNRTKVKPMNLKSHGVKVQHVVQPERVSTDQLFDLCEKFDLYFIVIADRFPSSRTVDELKDRYYNGICLSLYCWSHPILFIFSFNIQFVWYPIMLFNRPQRLWFFVVCDFDYFILCSFSNYINCKSFITGWSFKQSSC